MSKTAAGLRRFILWLNADVNVALEQVLGASIFEQIRISKAVVTKPFYKIVVPFKSSKVSVANKW